VGDTCLPESKRYSGIRRNVDHSVTGERSPANDRDDDATAVIEVDDADLRPQRQAGMRRNQSSETRVLEIRGRQSGYGDPSITAVAPSVGATLSPS